MTSGWNQRFFASTRGQVVTLLRQQGHATVEDLAAALGLTDNAVRAHLAALERDGLVAQRGLRRGVGKPAYTYALTSQAELLFPKAYGSVLDQLLAVLGEQLAPAAVDALMREVGHRLAAGHVPPTGELRARVEDALELVRELGGLAYAEPVEGGFVILGRSCPLAAAVAGHPETCVLVETLLADVIGASVCQRCDPAIPRCRFEVGISPGRTSDSADQ